MIIFSLLHQEKSSKFWEFRRGQLREACAGFGGGEGGGIRCKREKHLPSFIIKGSFKKCVLSTDYQRNSRPWARVGGDRLTGKNSGGCNLL